MNFEYNAMQWVFLKLIRHLEKIKNKFLIKKYYMCEITVFFNHVLIFDAFIYITYIKISLSNFSQANNNEPHI
jgi:hypothetical protein